MIAVDRNPDAPGFSESDGSLQISAHRPAAIYRLLQTQLTGAQIKGIGSRSFGAAAATAAALAERLGVPGPGWSSTRLFANKRRLKEKLAAAGVAMPRSFSWGRNKDTFSVMSRRRPLIARPARGFGKVGIEILQRTTDLRRFLREAGPDNGKFLLEQVVEGLELTVLGLVNRGVYVPVSISRKEIASTPLFAEVMHSFPAQISDETRTRVHSSMQALVHQTGLGTGPIVAEFIINSKGQPLLVEASPEVGGEYIGDCIAEVGAGFPIFDNLVANACGLPIRPASGTMRAVVIRYVMPRDGVLAKLAFPQTLLAHPDLLFAKALQVVGRHTDTKRGNLDRLAVFALVSADAGDVERLKEEAERLAEWVEIEYEQPNRTTRRVGKTLPKAKVKALLSR